MEHEYRLLRDYSQPLPWLVYKLGILLLTLGQWLVSLCVPPASQVTAQCGNFIVSAWLMLAADLNIPELLKDGPKTAEEIARDAGGLRSDDIYRGLRMLASYRFFEALPGAAGCPTRFRNNAASATLRADHPNTVKYVVLSWYADAYTAFARDAQNWRVRQPGEHVPCAFEHVRGQSFWDHLKADPAAEADFSKAMASGDSVILSALLQDFPWHKFRRLIDVGGANGSVLAAVLGEHASMHGALFDQPQVVQRAAAAWKGKGELQGLLARISMVGGSFFQPETMPPGRDGDLYFLRNILHDWSDTDSLSILRSLRKAIGSASATLVVCEFALIPEHSRRYPLNFRYVIDMLMHGVVGGKERTEAELRDLLAAAGFRLAKVHETRVSMFMIEAVPV